MLPRTLSEVVIVPTSYYLWEVMSMKHISAGKAPRDVKFTQICRSDRDSHSLIFKKVSRKLESLMLSALSMDYLINKPV